MNADSEAASAMEIRTRAWPALAWTHLTVRGTLDVRTRTRLLATVGAAVGARQRITLDLSEVSDVDPAGVRAIRECEALADEQDADLTVEDPSPAVRRALKAEP